MGVVVPQSAFNTCKWRESIKLASQFSVKNKIPLWGEEEVFAAAQDLMHKKGS